MTSAATTQPAADSVNRSVWRIDPTHSLVEFTIRRLMAPSVKGHFTGVNGTILGWRRHARVLVGYSRYRCDFAHYRRPQVRRASSLRRLLRCGEFPVNHF